MQNHVVQSREQCFAPFIKLGALAKVASPSSHRSAILLQSQVSIGLCSLMAAAVVVRVKGAFSNLRKG